MTTKKPSVRKKAAGNYHHGDLKEALKTAALRLVREKGAKGFSLNEASRLAGVTVAAPYRHFADKDALLAEIASDGCRIMTRELKEAVSHVNGTHEKMLECGMAYLRFSSKHSDYFAVIFNSGLDKSKHPDAELSAREAFEVISALSQIAESTIELAAQRAVSAWGLVHGLATLTADGALATAIDPEPDFEHLRSIVWQFLKQPYQESI